MLEDLKKALILCYILGRRSWSCASQYEGNSEPVSSEIMYPLPALIEFNLAVLVPWIPWHDIFFLYFGTTGLIVGAFMFWKMNFFFLNMIMTGGIIIIHCHNLKKISKDPIYKQNVIYLSRAKCRRRLKWCFLRWRHWVLYRREMCWRIAYSCCIHWPFQILSSHILFTSSLSSHSMIIPQYWIKLRVWYWLEIMNLHWTCPKTSEVWHCKDFTIFRLMTGWCWWL